MRDGAVRFADVFRPNSRDKVPVLLITGVYRKDTLWRALANLKEKVNPYMSCEAINTEWWRNLCIEEPRWDEMFARLRNSLATRNKHALKI